MYMILAVMMLQWHFIGRIDDIKCLVTTTIQQNLRHLFCLQLKICKSKNIRSEQDMPTQIFFASIDRLACPVLNLALYVEMFGTQGLGRIFFDWKSPCRFAEYLEKLFASSHFKAARAGKLGTHSLRKGPSTYASWFGLLRDWMSLHGHQRLARSRWIFILMWTCHIPMQKLRVFFAAYGDPVSMQQGTELTSLR
jgi:hypothetical protein